MSTFFVSLQACAAVSAASPRGSASGASLPLLLSAGLLLSSPWTLRVAA